MSVAEEHAEMYAMSMIKARSMAQTKMEKLTDDEAIEEVTETLEYAEKYYDYYTDEDEVKKVKGILDFYKTRGYITEKQKYALCFFIADLEHILQEYEFQ